MELVKRPGALAYLKRLFAYLLFCYLLACCTNPAGQLNHRQNNTEERQGALIKPPSGFSDTMVIEAPAAVFFNPGSEQLHKIKDITDTAVFESMVHDCYYQMKNARAVIKNYYPHVQIIEPHFVRYLLYTPNGGRRELVDLDKKNDPCGVILFDGVKPSRLTDMTNIDTDLGFYFRK